MEIRKLSYEEIFTIIELMRESVQGLEKTAKEFIILKKELEFEILKNIILDAISNLSHVSRTRPVLVTRNTKFGIHYGLAKKLFELQLIQKSHSALNIRQMPILQSEINRITLWRDMCSGIDFYIKVL